MKTRELPESLHKRAKAIIEELCEWCGKPDSDDCPMCCFSKALVLIYIRRPRRELQKITSEDVGKVEDILNPI